MNKENIEKLIEARIDRFNKLYTKALGYSFEDEVKIEHEKYEQAKKHYDNIIQPLVDKRVKELGFESEDDYLNYIYDNNVERDEILQAYWKSIPNSPSPLYTYEMTVINQAKDIVFWFIDTYPGEEVEKWKSIALGIGSYDVVKKIQELGYSGWNEGHSGNSGAMSVGFADCLIRTPELFPYMHGALCYLVGDEGYNDDRSDVHEVVEKYRKEHPEEIKN